MSGDSGKRGALRHNLQSFVAALDDLSRGAIAREHQFIALLLGIPLAKRPNVSRLILFGAEERLHEGTEIKR
jgi:hypothetical protein